MQWLLILQIITFLIPYILGFFNIDYFSFINGTVTEKQKILYLVITVIIVISIILEICLLLIQYKNNKSRKENIEIEKKNERAKMVLSQINLLVEQKVDLLKYNTYEKNIKNVENLTDYNVHGYLKNICINLRSTISQLVNYEEEYIDVSMIYSYYEPNTDKINRDWKWICGQSGASSSLNLNEFIKDKTLFNYIIENPDVSPYFCKDKRKDKHYELGSRDRLFEETGSIIAILLTYHNNESELIDVILIISSYGINFLPNNNNEFEKFKHIMVYEILPYYISIIQSELAIMYANHYKKNKVKY